MIARTWHGMVPKTKKKAYMDYLKRTGLPDYQGVAGNRGVRVLVKDANKVTHFFLITFWDSVQSIKKFAGEDFTKAKYYPLDKDYLLELEPFVDHFDVLDPGEKNPVSGIAAYFRNANGQLGNAAWTK